MSGIYTPIIKTLHEAVPSVTEDNIVKEWYVEVLYEYEGDSANNLPAWNIIYSEVTDVLDQNKAVKDYTKQELIDTIPTVYEERIFHDHYEAFVLHPKTSSETVSDFSIEQLS